MPESTFKESFKVAADQLVDAVKKLLHEGNVRRIVIKQAGRTVAEFPLTVGVIGAVFAPILAAVGALAAVLTDCTLEVERAVPRRQGTCRVETTSTARRPCGTAQTNVLCASTRCVGCGRGRAQRENAKSSWSADRSPRYQSSSSRAARNPSVMPLPP